MAQPCEKTDRATIGRWPHATDTRRAACTKGLHRPTRARRLPWRRHRGGPGVDYTAARLVPSRRAHRRTLRLGAGRDARGSDISIAAARRRRVVARHVQRVRPRGLPARLGLDFLLAGYRLFVRFDSASGRRSRGLQILGSETDRWSMALGGRLFTSYAYRRVRARIDRDVAIRDGPSCRPTPRSATGKRRAAMPDPCRSRSRPSTAGAPSSGWKAAA